MPVQKEALHLPTVSVSVKLAHVEVPVATTWVGQLAGQQEARQLTFIQAGLEEHSPDVAHVWHIVCWS